MGVDFLLMQTATVTVKDKRSGKLLRNATIEAPEADLLHSEMRKFLDDFMPLTKVVDGEFTGTINGKMVTVEIFEYLQSSTRPTSAP